MHEKNHSARSRGSYIFGFIVKDINLSLNSQRQTGEKLKSLTISTNKVIKSRIKKSYRIPVIDERLRKSRTKSEAKIISKLQNIIYVPKIIKTDDKQEIIMEYINGKKLSDNFELLDYKTISKANDENRKKI